ncbi:MAG: Crp/Fnr family transcriptional regulator [Bacteroidales bacterium]|nr:Crp/Fnr family transcriptional regulator [Bacteroidales bacterium]MCF8389874.1 Crp/Fnr family transcriptional regulator [Bacteroidales bacterium]
MENTLQFTACTISAKHRGCFDKLTEKEHQLLEKSSVKVSYKKGEVICKQGAFASHIILMEEGLSKVFIETNTNSLILKLVPGGNFIGMATVAESQNVFPYSATAYIDSVVKQIDRSVFRQLLTQNQAFALEIIDILSANSLQIYGRFFCLTQKQAYGRLADIILCLAERVFKANEFDLPLSRKDLAELCGMSQETVIRMLNKFSSEGLIKMTGKQFHVIDHESLNKISRTG